MTANSDQYPVLFPFIISLIIRIVLWISPLLIFVVRMLHSNAPLKKITQMPAFYSLEGKTFEIKSLKELQSSKPVSLRSLAVFKQFEGVEAAIGTARLRRFQIALAFKLLKPPSYAG